LNIAQIVYFCAVQTTRILIIRFSSIGDIVLTTPVVRRLKLQLEGDIEVHYLTKKSFASLLTSNPHITKVHTIEKATAEVIEELRELDFDYIIDLHKNVRSAMVKRDLRGLSFTLDKLNFKKWWFVNFGIDRMPKTHIVDRYLDTIRGFGTEDDAKGLDFFIPEDSEVDLKSTPEFLHTGYVALAIGAAHVGKRMSKEQLTEVLGNIDLPVVLIGGPQDLELADQLSVNRSQVYNACGKYSVLESASLIRQAQVVIAGDTGMMHIASAFGKCIVSVWGCTVPELGMGPYRPHPKSIIIEPKDLTKRPCSKLGNRCKYGEKDRCITHNSAQGIVRAAQDLFSVAQKVL
jgi:ADP-heptose:LPS heptosyltransferase